MFLTGLISCHPQSSVAAFGQYGLQLQRIEQYIAQLERYSFPSKSS